MSCQIQLLWVAMQAIHFHAFGWSLAWSLVYSFATFWYTEPGIPGEVGSGKVKQLLAIDQTSDWSLAIYFVLEKSVACSTKCGVCFNYTLSIVHVIVLSSFFGYFLKINDGS